MLAAPQLLQQLPGYLQMLRRIGAGGVADVEDHIRLHRLLQSGTERLHQLVGQAPHKAHRVHQHHLPSIRQPQCPGGGVEGGEQLILRQHTGVGEGVQQGGFPGVGVPHQRHGGDPVLAAALPPQGALAVQLFQLLPQGGNAAADVAPIALQFALAGTSGADAASQPGQRRSLPAQPGQPVLQLRQLHLQPPLRRLRPSGEDV